MIIHEVSVNKKRHKLQVLKRTDNTFLIELDGKPLTVTITDPIQGRPATVHINGRTFHAEIDKLQANILNVRINGRRFEVQRHTKTLEQPAVKQKPIASVAKRLATEWIIDKDAVIAPIAGRIALFKTKIGQRVEEGECICVLEAMKMENEVAAPKAGVLKEIRVSKGAIVNKGTVLAIIV